MKQAIVIKTNALDSSTLELYEYLEEYFGNDVYVALECYSQVDLDLSFDGKVIKIGRQFLERNGLRYFQQSGWQCGDYVYYAVLPFVEVFDHVWLIESDVRITMRASDLFNRFSDIGDDLLGINLGVASKNWFWYQSMFGYYGDVVCWMQFPLSRLSRSAIHKLMHRRIEYCASQFIVGINFDVESDRRLFANDEAFVATTVYYDGLTYQSLNSILSNELADYFSTCVPVLEDELSHSDMRGRVIHPVCDIKRARSKVMNLRKKDPRSQLLATREFEIRKRLGDEVGNAVFGDSKMDSLVQHAHSYFSNPETGGEMTPYYRTAWVWEKHTLVIDFEFKGLRIGVNIEPAVQGQHSVELVLRANQHALGMDWSQYGKRTGSHVRAFSVVSFDDFNPLFPALRSGHRLFQRPSHRKQIPSSLSIRSGRIINQI